MLVIGVSTLVSLWRGFVREALSLGAWVAAFVVAALLTDRLTVMLEPHISHEAGRFVLAYAVLFIATLVLGALINSLMAQLIRITGLSGIDRILGMAFGVARGLIIVVVLTLVAVELVPVEAGASLEESRLMPHINVVVDWARDLFDQLPERSNIALPDSFLQS